MSKLEKFLLYWLPPLGWMGLIFSASADTSSAQHSSRLFVPLLHWLFPGLGMETIETLHYAFRKCGHLTEFAVLALLFWRAVHRTRRPPATSKLSETTEAEPIAPQPGKGGLVAPKRSEGGWRWDEAGLALTLVFVYAATDEFHQVFVPQRTAMVSDIFIDVAGGAIGLLLLWMAGKFFKRW